MQTEKQTPSLLKLDRAGTALVVTDPQNDFLKEGGVAYGLFADNLREVGTIDNIDRLLKAARKSEVQVVMAPARLVPRPPRAASSRLSSNCGWTEDFLADPDPRLELPTCH